MIRVVEEEEEEEKEINSESKVGLTSKGLCFKSVYWHVCRISAARSLQDSTQAHSTLASSRSFAHSKFSSNNSPWNVDHLQAQRPYSHRVKNFVTKEASKLFQDFREKCLFPFPLAQLHHQTTRVRSEHFQTKMKNEEGETWRKKIHFQREWKTAKFSKYSGRTLDINLRQLLLKGFCSLPLFVSQFSEIFMKVQFPPLSP